MTAWDENYRKLEEGEIVAWGDEVFDPFSETWTAARCINSVVQWWAVGAYRRPKPVSQWSG